MSERVTAGIYPAMDLDTYYADPAPQPSLTQTIAKLLLSQSPRHAWHAHPRLNPMWQRQSDDNKFDLGTTAHSLLLGRGQDVVVCSYADWRTKSSQLERASLREQGKMPVLQHQFAHAEDMVRAARLQLSAAGYDIMAGGESEVAIVWREGSIWCRTLIDRYQPLRGHVIDYKTTDGSASPEQAARSMIFMGWDVQAAMHEMGLEKFHKGHVWQHLFIAQETYPPYALSICRLGELAMSIGRHKLRRAMRTWHDCLSKNDWPGYGDAELLPPAWAVSEHENRIAEAELARS